MNTFKGIIIEESLENTEVLKKTKVLSTKVEAVTDEHKTPWIEQWTMHTVEIPEGIAKQVAESISHSLDPKHRWYADFKNNQYHYIIFRDKVFFIDRSKKAEYDEATRYGILLGIPDYQLDFSPEIKEWQR